MKPPCHNCSDRHVGCHARCERYKTFTTEQQEIKRRQQADREYRDYTRDRYDRVKKIQEQHRYTAFMKRWVTA